MSFLNFLVSNFLFSISLSILWCVCYFNHKKWSKILPKYIIIRSKIVANEKKNLAPHLFGPKRLLGTSEYSYFLVKKNKRDWNSTKSANQGATIELSDYFRKHRLFFLLTPKNNSWFDLQIFHGMMALIYWAAVLKFFHN